MRCRLRAFARAFPPHPAVVLPKWHVVFLAFLGFSYGSREADGRWNLARAAPRKMRGRKRLAYRTRRTSVMRSTTNTSKGERGRGESRMPPRRTCDRAG